MHALLLVGPASAGKRPFQAPSILYARAAVSGTGFSREGAISGTTSTQGSTLDRSLRSAWECSPGRSASSRVKGHSLPGRQCQALSCRRLFRSFPVASARTCTGLSSRVRCRWRCMGWRGCRIGRRRFAPSSVLVWAKSTMMRMAGTTAALKSWPQWKPDALSVVWSPPVAIGPLSTLALLPLSAAVSWALWAVQVIGCSLPHCQAL